MRLRNVLFALATLTPAFGGVLVVVARNSVEQVQTIPTDTTVQTITDALVVIGGIVLTYFASYLRSKVSQAIVTAKEAKAEARDTPTKLEFETLRTTVITQNGRIALLDSQLTLLNDSYKTVVIERDRARDENRSIHTELDRQMERNNKTTAELEESRATIAVMSRRQDEQDDRYEAMEKRLLAMENVNQLAERIISHINGLVQVVTITPPALPAELPKAS